MRKQIFLFVGFLASTAMAEITSTRIGQAYSYAQGQTQLEVELFDGTGPSVGGSLGLRVNRLEIQPVKIELEMGESYSLRDLSVRAFGSNNVFVEEAPLTITLEAPDDLIELAAFRADGHTLRANQPGIGRLWINSMAPAFRGENFQLPVVLVVNGQRAIPQPPFLY